MLAEEITNGMGLNVNPYPMKHICLFHNQETEKEQTPEQILLNVLQCCSYSCRFSELGCAPILNLLQTVSHTWVQTHFDGGSINILYLALHHVVR